MSLTDYLVAAQVLPAFVLAVANDKGGVGKTVTSVNLGAALAERGLKTVLIDLDPAHGLTRYFNLSPTGATSSEVLLGQSLLTDAMTEVRNNLFLCPATSDLNTTKAILANSSAPEVRLDRALRKMKSEGLIVILDCPGAWDILTRNAVFASNAIITPINSEAAAMVQAVDTIDNSRELAELHGRALATWPLITCYRATKVPKLVAELSEEQFGDDLLKTRIRRAERINEIGANRETLSDITTSAAGPVKSDYNDLADEIIERRCHL